VVFTFDSFEPRRHEGAERKYSSRAGRLDVAVVHLRIMGPICAIMVVGQNTGLVLEKAMKQTIMLIIRALAASIWPWVSGGPILSQY
jgi:hypothetical protein